MDTTKRMSQEREQEIRSNNGGKPITKRQRKHLEKRQAHFEERDAAIRAAGGDPDRHKEHREAIYGDGGDVAKALEQIRSWSIDDPRKLREVVVAAGMPLAAQSIILASAPGPPCVACGRRLYGSPWAVRQMVKIAGWVEDQNIAVINILNGVGVGTMDELRELVHAAKAAHGIESEEDGYRAAIAYANQYRRERGLAELIEPEKVTPALVTEGGA